MPETGRTAQEIATALKAASWPSAELEMVKQCPVCGSPDRSILYADLWDASFLCAPGLWRMWSCSGCRSAYLDPRPTAASIGRAYERYYTHQAPVPIRLPQSRLQYARRALANGYRNWRFGGKLDPSWEIGAPLSLIFPTLRRAIDYKYRNLPRPGRGSHVLDVGCGSGEWLALAETSGWVPHGIDFDPKCVERACQRGLDVRHDTIETYAHASETFDAVTMSHVIEHVDNPPSALRKIFALLRPGGMLYLDTPNIDAPTHHQFGKYWRGLETPRHLVLFNPDSLRSLLRASGFEEIKFHPAPGAKEYLIEASQEMSELDGAKLDQNFRSVVGSEFLTITCIRPNDRKI